MALVGEFHQTPQWPGVDFCAGDFRQTAERILDQGAIFLTGKGLIGLLVVPSIYNHAAKVACEMFFWAPDGQGDALRRAAEQWASGADVLIMNQHDAADERIARWYARKGYVAMGRQYAKVM